jgi:hypothetical protein
VRSPIRLPRQKDIRGDLIERTGVAKQLGPQSIFPAHGLVFQSTAEAFVEGRRRLEQPE